MVFVAKNPRDNFIAFDIPLVCNARPSCFRLPDSVGNIHFMNHVGKMVSASNPCLCLLDSFLVYIYLNLSDKIATREVDIFRFQDDHMPSFVYSLIGLIFQVVVQNLE